MKLSQYIKLICACTMAAAIALTACAQPAQPPAANTKPEPSKYGGTLKIGLPAAPTSLDSFVMVTGPAGTIWKAYGLTLVRWIGKNDREATVAPCLAKSWELSPDGFTYTFHLQEGIKWQNTPLMKGRDFTADDLAYFYGRVNDPANRYQSRPNLDIKSFEAVDKYTFKMTNNNKTPGFMAYMAHGAGIVQPKEAVTAPGGVEKNWAGAGPFMMTDYERESKAILKKNPDYFDKGKPYLDSVEFYFMKDPAARLAAFRSGQIDVLPSEGRTNKDAIEKSVKDAQIHDGIAMMEQGLLLNNSRTPFDNKLVRQAIQYAIDYDGLIKAALDGAGLRTGYLAPWFKEWGGKQPSEMPQRDIAKAKALLAQAGYPDGFKTTILQNTGAMETTGNAIEPLVAMLKEAGINATIIPVDGASFISKWRSSDFDMTIGTLYTGRPYDVTNSLQQMWPTKSTANFMKYSNPTVDQLVTAQQNAFPDKDKRIPLVKQIVSILEEDVPSIPLYITTNYFIKQPWVKGWDDMADPQAGGATSSLPYVWIER